MSPIISVQNLSKRYIIGHQRGKGDGLRHRLEDAVRNPWKWFRNGVKKTEQEEFWALKDVSFDVQQGEVLGIIGRNGAGKSTLLKILSRITEPTEGRVTIKGRVASLLEVGTGFHPELTGRENIFLNGAILGMTRAEIKKKFDEIIAFAEVERFLDTPVKRYSSGMYVRLAFAVAAHLEPEILIIDEVLAVGDVGFQQKCLGKIRDVSNEGGRTVLFVSHNLEAIQTLCRRCFCLQRGTIVSDGKPNLVTLRYLQDTEGSGMENGPLGGDVLSIKEIRLIGSDGNKRQHGMFLEPFGVRVFLLTTKPFLDITCGIGIINGKGELVFGINSRELGLQHIRVNGATTLEIQMPSQNLLPGRYYLWLQVHDSLGNLLLDEKHACSIDIQPPRRSSYTSLGSGDVHLSTVWSWS